jgi:mRNA-degrading endonuclease HigB of HigAB toxin-antitoxin module
MVGLENPGDYTGHALRRTAATVMADKGASGQTLRHKLNQRSEKAVNEYLSSSKAVQRSNAMMLSGFEEKTKEISSSQTTPIASLSNEASEESFKEDNASESDVEVISPPKSPIATLLNESFEEPSKKENTKKNFSESDVEVITPLKSPIATLSNEGFKEPSKVENTKKNSESDVREKKGFFNQSGNFTFGANCTISFNYQK